MAHIKGYYTKIEQMRVFKGLESHTVPLCRTIGRDGDSKCLHRRSDELRSAHCSGLCNHIRCCCQNSGMECVYCKIDELFSPGFPGARLMYHLSQGG